MDWPAWAIPLIALVIWIIANVARGVEAGRKDQQPGPRPVQRPRPATTEIDRFLEELNRRRQQQRRPPERPAERRPGPRPRPTPGRPQPPPPQPVVVVPVPTVELVVPEVLPAQPVRPAEPSPPSFTHPPQPPPAAGQPREIPAHLMELLRLFRSGQGLRAAFLAQEILGPPRSRRPLRPR